MLYEVITIEVGFELFNKNFVVRQVVCYGCGTGNIIVKTVGFKAFLHTK